MRKREDYTFLIGGALLLSLGILITLQIYILREPGRIQSVLAADKTTQIANGRELFAQNCTTCHGENGEGDVGPALNNKTFLKTAEDGRIASLISSGVPGTAMPSWSETFGGPFTDEQIHALVAFLRSWEATATDATKPKPTPDASVGQDIFTSICYACHGPNGEGTTRAPALNSKDLLTRFNNDWFRQTIANGRPAQGMPTWGKVLSPEQIDDVVAFLRSWEPTAPVIQTPAAKGTTAPTTVAQAPTALTSATPGATSTLAPTPTSTATPTTAVVPTTVPVVGGGPVPNCGKANCTQPGAALALTGNAGNGATLYVANCKKCHGDQGKGGVSNPGSSDGTIPPLNPTDPQFKIGNFRLNLDLFIEHGSTPEGPSPVNVMDAWGDKRKLSAQQIADLIAYILSLNP